MHEQPSAAELLEAVARFLRLEALPLLPGRTGFHARVAANVVDIVRREMQGGGAAIAAETERLAALLGHTGDGDALNRELCARISAGEIAENDPALLHHLWQTTLDRVAIDQPQYATYRRVMGDAGKSGKETA